MFPSEHRRSHESRTFMNFGSARILSAHREEQGVRLKPGRRINQGKSNQIAPNQT
jgi:hypothetical protein